MCLINIMMIYTCGSTLWPVLTEGCEAAGTAGPPLPPLHMPLLPPPTPLLPPLGDLSTAAKGSSSSADELLPAAHASCSH